MARMVAALVVVLSTVVQAQEDGGVPAAAPPPAPVVAGYDVVQTPWGPGRKTSGEAFKSMALPLPAGVLRWAWDDLSLGVGGQYLMRGESRTDSDFNRSAGDLALGIEHRARLSVRASMKERVGVLLEYQDVRAWGAEASTVALLPATTLHQGFFDLKPTKWLDVRVGRQELSYGEDRLVGNLDWAMMGRAFDGLFLRFTANEKITVDAFGMMLKPPAWVTPDGGGDRFHVSGSFFSGLYARVRLGKAGFDVYGLGLMEDPSTATTGMRRDNNRFTLGARGFAGLGGLALLGEGAYQLGRTGQVADAVQAGAFAARATYTLKVWGNPYVMAEFTGATGDGTAGDGVDGTFHQMFPTGHAHLGFMDYVGWQNVMAGRGTLGFRPGKAHVWLDVHHFRMWDPKGAWYAANGAVFIAADPARTDGTMGTEVNLSFTVPMFDQVALAGAVAVFLPGGAASGRGTAPSTWGFLSVRSQF